MIDTLLIATGNAKKLEEIRAVFDEQDQLGVTLCCLRDLKGIPAEPVEDGATFEDNAKLKATYYARQTGLWCLADDSGLEVDALGGEPGVRSARYADATGDRGQRDQANNRKLLTALTGVERANRRARFVCVMSLADPEGTVHHSTRGTFEGLIGEAPRGENGFGYDPLLTLPDGSTVAELAAVDKNACSHRGQAARAMVGHLRQLRQAD